MNEVLTSGILVKDAWASLRDSWCILFAPFSSTLFPFYCQHSNGCFGPWEWVPHPRCGEAESWKEPGLSRTWWNTTLTPAVDCMSLDSYMRGKYISISCKQLQFFLCFIHWTKSWLRHSMCWNLCFLRTIGSEYQGIRELGEKSITIPPSRKLGQKGYFADFTGALKDTL